MYELELNAVKGWVAKKAYDDSSFAIALALLMVADANKDIARAIGDLQESLRTDHPLMGETFEGLTQALNGIAEALE